MFMGEYRPSLDEKGRASIPMKLRKAFGENELITGLVMTHGFDKCIMAFREQDWQNFVQEKLSGLPQSDPKNRMRIRFLMGGASETDLDKQGRALIPTYLLEYAEIKKEIVILGVHDRIEIWSRERYEQYRPDGEELSSFVQDLGF